jgi:hypothetical protein
MEHDVGDIEFTTTTETLNINAEASPWTWYKAIRIAIGATSQKKTVDFIAFIKSRWCLRIIPGQAADQIKLFVKEINTAAGTTQTSVNFTDGNWGRK